MLRTPTLFSVPALLCAHLAVTQAAGPLRVSAPLMDLVVYGDSQYGVTLLAAPSLGSRQGYKRTQVEHLSIDPVQLRVWLPKAQRVMDSGPSLSAAAGKKPIGIRLVADRGRASLTLGFDPSVRGQDHHVATIRDSSTGRAWSAALPDTVARQLLAALETASTSSRLLLPRDTVATRALLVCELDTPPVLTKVPHLRHPDRHDARVWAMYVVTSDGRADFSQARILLSDGPQYEDAIREGLTEARFSPALKDGRPVAALVFQPFTFKGGS